MTSWGDQHAGEPYTPSQVGPSGYDCSGFVEKIYAAGEFKPVDWNKLVRDDRRAALRILVRLELRMLRDRVERWLIDRMSHR